MSRGPSVILKMYHHELHLGHVGSIFVCVEIFLSLQFKGCGDVLMFQERVNVISGTQEEAEFSNKVFSQITHTISLEGKKIMFIYVFITA